MQRAHSLPFAKDIAFVDSTASCDAHGHSVTIMLTACGIGAVPLALMVTKGQSIKDYIAAFTLLKESVPFAFSSEGYPKQFMTDDSEAERQALKTVWPSSKSLLCRFHICQSVWRWLFEIKHSICKDDRKTLYKAFQNCLVSSTKEEAEKSFNIMTGIGSNDKETIFTKYPQWISYVTKYWKRKEIWCLAFRDASMHGHHTNNFSEVNVRIFKDIVLSRNKAYNAIALVDFICTSMEEYYIRRLRNFVNGRTDKSRLLFQDQLHRAAHITKNCIELVDDDLYKVKQKDSSDFYEVNVSVGYCSCPVGKYGSFCKHQAAIYNLYHYKMPNLPPICHETRYLLAKLAFGDEAQSNKYYMPLISSSIESNTIVSECNTGNSSNMLDTEQSNIENQINDINNEETEVMEYEETEAMENKETEAMENTTSSEEYKNQIISLMTDNFKKFPSPSLHVLSKCVQRLKNVKTLTGWESFIATAGSSISLRHRGRAIIGVQPTTISRRRPGITRGSKRLPVGQPKKVVKTKRNRNLQENVNKNVPNAKSHGTNH